MTIPKMPLFEGDLLDPKTAGAKFIEGGVAQANLNRGGGKKKRKTITKKKFKKKGKSRKKRKTRKNSLKKINLKNLFNLLKQ